MAKFKKLAMLCTALMMTASLAAIAACGGSSDESGSTPDSTTTESSTPNESSEPAESSEPDESSEPEESSSSEEDSSSSEEGGIPDADSTISIAKALEIGSAMEHDTYTEGKYYVSGTIKEVKNATYGNVVIEDEKGDSIYVYGTWSADGSVRYDALEVKPGVGDEITVYGIVGQYNDTPQIKNGWITAFTNNGEDPVVDVPEADSTLTIAEAVALGESLKGDTEGKYYVSGTITKIANAKYGNMTIEDSNGDSIYVYGTYSADGSVRYDALASAPQVGDTVRLYSIVSYYNGAQLKNAWIVGSSSYGPIIPVKDYATVAEGEEGSLTAESAWSAAWGTVTFNVSQPGLYGIYAVDENFQESGVKFGPADTTDSSVCAMRYLFEVYEEGEVTLSTYYFFYSADTLNFNYYVYQVSPIVAEETEGAAILPTNVRVPITFTVEEAGEYVITSNDKVTWYESAATDDDGSQGYTYTVRAAEAGEVTLYVENGNYSYENFTFEYGIHAVKPVAVKEGNTFVKLYAGVNTPVTFTADQDGVYTLSVDSNYTVYAGDDYESSYRFVAKKGETVTLHINYAGYSATTPSITEKVSVAAYEVANLNSLQLGENVCLATENGVTATFTAPKDGTYEFDDNSEYSMWFEGVTDGTSNKQIELTKGQSVTFIIKCDGLVTVTIQRNAPVLPFMLDTPVAVTIPAGETVALEAFLSISGYQIVWDSSVANLVVTYGYQTLANGDTFTVNSSWYATAITFTNNGAEEVSFNVTVSEILPPPISLGENTVHVDDVFNGVYVSFTATEAGTYILKAAEGEEYASVSIKGQEYYPLNLPYMFTLTAGESIKFTVNTSNYEVYEDEISLVLTFEGESGGAVEPTVIQIEPDAGAQFVDIPANGSVILEMYVYGDYKVEWQAANLVVTFEGQPIANDSVITAVSPRLATQLVLTTSDGAALSGKVIMVSTYVEPTPELVLGDNAINVPSDGVEVTFTATTAGKYVLSAADGETNAFVQTGADYDWNDCTLPYEFTLAEGESINFMVCPFNWNPDEINLVLAVARPTTPSEIVDAAYALAAGASLEGTYSLTGTISSVDTAYSSQHNNVTVTIKVEGKEDKPIKCYRLVGGETLKKGDVITVTGELTNFKGTIEFDAGCTYVLVFSAPEEPVVGLELSFADKANRTSFSTTEQIWKQNGVTLTNTKGSSTSNIADYAAPARFYKSSSLTIDCTGMKKITFNCNDYKNSYATDLQASITDANATVTVDGLVVIVEFATSVNSFTIAPLAGQVRVNSLVVVTE